MKVFKFGGASINSVERIQNVGNILKGYKGEKILVIISAMGKTTNALEKVVDAFFEGRKEDALHFFQQVKDQHLNTLKYLTTLHWKAAEDHLKDLSWLLIAHKLAQSVLFAFLNQNPWYLIIPRSQISRSSAF